MTTTGTVRHLWALEAPMLTVDKSVIQLGSGGENVTVPSPAFLIEHPAHGLLLFDTGLAIDAAGDPHRAYGELADAFPIHFPEEILLDRQLTDLGYTTGDVKRLVLSHTHFDHTGGLAHFPDAQGYVGYGELRYCTTPGRFDAGMFRAADLEGGPSSWLEVPPGFDHDVFGDGSVTILSLPGHTVGTLGLRLQTPDGVLVLTGDAAHLQENIVIGAGMPFDQRTDEKLSSMRKLELFADQPDTTVWVNHDPGDWAQHRAHGAQIF